MKVIQSTLWVKNRSSLVVFSPSLLIFHTSRSYLNQLVVYSLLKHLGDVYLDLLQPIVVVFCQINKQIYVVAEYFLCSTNKCHPFSSKLDLFDTSMMNVYKGQWQTENWGWRLLHLPILQFCFVHNQTFNRGAHGSHFWSTFDSSFIHFCRHKPSEMKWKMNQKMRAMKPTPLKISKMRSKMSEKWNSRFFGTLAALNSTSHCRPHFILSFFQCYL